MMKNFGITIIACIIGGILCGAIFIEPINVLAAMIWGGLCGAYTDDVVDWYNKKYRNEK